MSKRPWCADRRGRRQCAAPKGSEHRMMDTHHAWPESIVRTSDPIAIVGASCRLPSAPNLTAFWRLLVDGRDVVEKVPPERFDIDAWYDPAPGKTGSIVSREGGFLEDIELFD